jgi:tetraacyldisaccharide 4'-kinase
MDSIQKNLRQPLGDGIFPAFLSALYGSAVCIRNLSFDHLKFLAAKIGRPAVSIGGLHAGGTGKTPMALLTAAGLVEAGRPVAFLSRGYGRRYKGIVVCNPGVSAAWNVVGDEPAMLHDNLPQSWLGVFPNRRSSARLLCKEIPSNAVFVLDDGFQHRRVARAFDVVCLPPSFFSDKLLPAGTLREPFSSCNRADFLCVIGMRAEADECAHTKETLESMFPGKPIAVLYQTPGKWHNLVSGATCSVPPCPHPLLLSGIARPERFSSMMREMGITPGASHFFDDHHPFTQDEIRRLCGNTRDCIITTEKDAFRLRSIKLVNGPDIWYLKIDLSFADGPSKDLFFTNLNDSITSYIPMRR